MSGTALAVKALRDANDPDHHGDVAATLDAHAAVLGFAAWATGADLATLVACLRERCRAPACARVELTSIDARGRWGTVALLSELVPLSSLSVDLRAPPRPGGPGAVVLAMARSSRLPPDDDGRRWDLLLTDVPAVAPPNAGAVVAIGATDDVEAAWSATARWHARCGPLLVAFF